MAGPTDMLFGMRARSGPSNHVLDGSPDPPREMGMLGHDRGQYTMWRVIEYFDLLLPIDTENIQQP